MTRLPFLLMLLLCPSYSMSQEGSPERKEFGGLELELFRNTDSISQAVAINSRGSIVGSREIQEQKGVETAFRQVSFYSGLHGTKDISIPESFTNFEVVGISDTELVTGYATRPLKHPEGSLRGIVWNPKNEEFSLLPISEGDRVCQSQDISSDGKRITGYATGLDRLRPALWEFDEERNTWGIEVLPTIHENNPYLMSGRLVISPNGKLIAGCCTEVFRDDGVIDSSLFLWVQGQDQKWSRRVLSQEQMYLYGINDHGELVGSVRSDSGGRLPCFISADGQIVMLDLLQGDVSGEARAINNSSTIVGFSDDPIGSVGGPDLCIWNKDGRARRIGEPGTSYGSILGINDAGQMAGMIEILAKDTLQPGSDTEENPLLAFRTVK